jgi:hypothetical protein
MNHDCAQHTSVRVLENPGHQDGQAWGVDDEEHEGHFFLHHAAQEERRQMPHPPNHAEDQTGGKWTEAIKQAHQGKSTPAEFFTQGPSDEEIEQQPEELREIARFLKRIGFSKTHSDPSHHWDTDQDQRVPLNAESPAD